MKKRRMYLREHTYTRIPDWYVRQRERRASSVLLQQHNDCPELRSWGDRLDDIKCATGFTNYELAYLLPGFSAHYVNLVITHQTPAELQKGRLKGRLYPRLVTIQGIRELERIYAENLAQYRSSPQTYNRLVTETRFQSIPFSGSAVECISVTVERQYPPLSFPPAVEDLKALGVTVVWRGPCRVTDAQKSNAQYAEERAEERAAERAAKEQAERERIKAERRDKRERVRLLRRICQLEETLRRMEGRTPAKTRGDIEREHRMENHGKMGPGHAVFKRGSVEEFVSGI